MALTAAGACAASSSTVRRVAVHLGDVGELATAIDIGARLIGVNTRNLKDLSVDTGRFAPLAALAVAGGGLGPAHAAFQRGVLPRGQQALPARIFQCVGTRIQGKVWPCLIV